MYKRQLTACQTLTASQCGKQRVVSGEAESRFTTSLAGGKAPDPGGTPSGPDAFVAGHSNQIMKVVNVDEARRAARLGPVPALEHELRTHCVSARLNRNELTQLDQLRLSVHMQRGEFLRAASLHQLPPRAAPELNRHAWAELARTAAALNQIAHRLNLVERGTMVAPEVADVRVALHSFRSALIGAMRR